ncbi:MAG: two-component regulator propeller domain-containing protein [Bacteroidota bacterium]|nr:two-component regulator propeller domain-containing protein [Bacteroidota bacterium]
MSNTKLILLVTWIVNLLYARNICAQDLNFTHYSVDNGLPSSQVHDIIQDKYGNLWFSTDQGLSSYNGYRFKNFTTNDGLTDNIIFKFYPQTNGEIWCTTFNKSVFYISGSEPVFKPYLFNKTLVSIPDHFITNCLYLSQDRSLYMSIINGSGYIHIDNNGKTLYNSINIFGKLTETVLLTDENENSFFFINSKDREEKISGNWLYKTNSYKDGSARSIIRACFFKKTGHSVFADFKNLRILKQNDTLNIPTLHEPISLGKLNDSLFWVGFRYGGITIYNMSGKQIRSFLPNKSVTKLFIDHEGGLWLSTLNDGVYHTNNTYVNSYRNNESDSWVNSLKQDRFGNLWIGYYNGNISVLSKNEISKKYTSHTKLPALIRYDKIKQQIYLISDNTFFAADNKQSLYNINVNPLNVTIHHNDSFLVASYRSINVLHNGEKKEIKIGFRVNDICYYGNTFYLASNRGLYKIQDQKIENIKNIDIPPSTKIADLDSWGNSLLIATKGSGVLILKNNLVYKIDKVQGLSNNIVSKIYIENDSTFWACTNSGLNRIVFKNNILVSVDIISNRNGLISNEVTDIEIIKDTIWVGTREGLCSFTKNMLQNKKKNTEYYLEINQLKVNDQLLPKKNMLSLNYNENRIELGFKAISFLENTPIIYRYKLSGLETKWNYTTRLSSVYTSLPPGSYTFCVQAKGNNHLWESGQQQFSFVISPPYWKTWWFRLSIFSVLAILVYLFFKFRILSYNRDITRELLRQLLKRLTKKANYVVFREQGKDIRIETSVIYFIKADGNYIEIHTDTKKYVIRHKIGEFLRLTPDPLEYLRISRSCIVRLDKIQEKSKKDVTIKGEKIPVGETYLDQLQKIKF